MAYGLSWISYRIPKSTTIGPTFSGTSESLTQAEEKNENQSYATFEGGTVNGQSGTTSKNNLYSVTFSEDVARVNVAIIVNATSTSYTNRSYTIGATTYSLTTENSIITFNARAGGVDATYPGTTSNITTRAFQTVSLETITDSTKTGFVTTTTESTSQSAFFTTTTINDKKTTTRVTNEIGITRSTRVSTNLPITTTTTNGTRSFKTFINALIENRVVYDTAWVRVVNPFDLSIRNILIAENSENSTDTSGINVLPFLSDSATTISWVPPISVEETWVREAFTSKKNNGDIETFTKSERYTETRTTVSTTPTSTRIFEGTQLTFTIEDWVTFTSTIQTTNSTTSGSRIITSASLNTGFTEIEYEYDDDGNETLKTITIVPQNWEATTATSSRSIPVTTTTTQSFTTTSRNDDLTYTTSTLKIDLQGFFLPVSFTGGYDIDIRAVPWTTKPGFDTSEAMSLQTESTIYESTEKTTRYRLTLETNATSSFSTSSSGFTQSGPPAQTVGSNSYIGKTTSSTNIQGTWFKTQSLELITTRFLFRDRAFATHQPSDRFLRAGSVDFDFVTTPDRTGGPLLLTMESNEHTLMLAFDDKNTGLEIPGFVVPLIYPTFSTVLNKATHGGGLHPSVWSSMTISRQGKSLSSTWRFENSRDISGTTYSTSSGECAIGTASQFPLGAEERNTQTLGGAMQPNTNIVAFRAKNVVHVTTYDSANSGTQFSTQSDFGFSTLAVNNAITLRREIPVIAGYGVTQLPLLDNGLP